MDSKKTQDMAIAQQRIRYTALFGKPPTKRLENNPRWLATQIENHAVIYEIAGLRKEYACLSSDLLNRLFAFVCDAAASVWSKALSGPTITCPRICATAPLP